MTVPVRVVLPGSGLVTWNTTHRSTQG
ncbi:hypothetical protein HNR02_001508 [Amycolatopsis endophytica]|uniref:Uncharacterized protein n=1 Tax=Amycolatopsis endophytica TaxID=860233 RepID=A0A853AZY8_9PSEU|nr:hypothetical protein [Amycolatopsis endophytica]